MKLSAAMGKNIFKEQNGCLKYVFNVSCGFSFFLTIRELYAEAIIEEVTVDGSLRLEYSLSGETINTCMEAKITSPEISIKVCKMTLC